LIKWFRILRTGTVNGSAISEKRLLGLDREVKLRPFDFYSGVVTKSLGAGKTGLTGPDPFQSETPRFVSQHALVQSSKTCDVEGGIGQRAVPIRGGTPVAPKDTSDDCRHREGRSC
jgi:hypothetical protein